MNKKEFIKVYRNINSIDISLKEAGKDIEILLETIKEGLKISGKVSFVKRGVFEILDKKTRNIANPSTGEIMRINPPRTIKFRVSKLVKQGENYDRVKK